MDTLDYGEVLAADPCCYCGVPSDQIDHIDPIARGGDAGWENLTAACKNCNQRKHAKSLLAFLAA